MNKTEYFEKSKFKLVRDTYTTKHYQIVNYFFTAGLAAAGLLRDPLAAAGVAAGALAASAGFAGVVAAAGVLTLAPSTLITTSVSFLSFFSFTPAITRVQPSQT